MPRLRPCLGYPGHRCAALTAATRCPQCATKFKPSAHQRGYGRDHQRQRDELKRTLPALCWYGCGTVLEPEGDWVAAHVVDGDPTSPRVASCRRCNEGAKRARG